MFTILKMIPAFILLGFSISHTHNVYIENHYGWFHGYLSDKWGKPTQNKYLLDHNKNVLIEKDNSNNFTLFFDAFSYKSIEGWEAQYDQNNNLSIFNYGALQEYPEKFNIDFKIDDGLIYSCKAQNFDGMIILKNLDFNFLEYLKNSKTLTFSFKGKNLHDHLVTIDTKFFSKNLEWFLEN